MPDTKPTRGTLAEREPHPMAEEALCYLSRIPYDKLLQYQGVFASCAIEGNRVGEVCGETLGRLLDKEPVSDRYLLGLAWMIRDMEEEGND